MSLIESLKWSACVAATAALGVACHVDPQTAETNDELQSSAPLAAATIRYTGGDAPLSVRFDRALDDDERVFIGVRRGHFGDLDCALADASPWMRQVSGQAETVSGLPERCFGPTVDDELQQSFYDASWFSGAHTPAMIAEAASGTDPIVDVCVLGPDGVRYAEEASLPLVIDETLERSERRHWSWAATGPGNRRINSGLKYAERCVEELGDIPLFTKNGAGDYETFDCTTATEIPVTVTDSAGNTTRATSTPALCDKPQHLGYGCEVGARVANATNARGTEWVLLCRRVINAAQGRFGDMAMIGHNPTSGKTCFFQNSLGVKTDGTKVSHPADTDDSLDTWRSYPSGGSCIGCHDTDPFIHTPWIDGAKKSSGRTVVPRVAYPGSPYSLVNMIDQGIRMPQQLVSPEAAACRACHRVGEWQTRKWPEYFTQTDGHVTSQKTAYYKQPERQYWMPPGASFTSKAQWDASRYGKAAAFIANCIGDPSQCEYEPIPGGPAKLRTVTDGCGLQIQGPTILQPALTPTFSLAPLPAEFACHTNGRDLEIVPAGTGRAVHVRTKKNGSYCYLAADYDSPFYSPTLFATTHQLGWDCVFGSKTELEVHYADDDRVRLATAGSNNTCGVRRDATTGAAYLDCNHAGDLLHIAADVRERWEARSVSTNQVVQYGPFDVIAGTRIEASISPAANSAGDADLYLRFGDAPTVNDFDCRPYTSGSNERCVQAVPTGHTKAFVMVRGYSGSTDHAVQVDYVTSD